MGLGKGLFGKKGGGSKAVHKKSKTAVFVHANDIFEAFKLTLPKKSTWTVRELDEMSLADFTGEELDLVMYAFPKPEMSLREDTAAEFLEERIFRLLELLEHLRAHPPKQFVFVSSWKAGDPNSVMGAVYRNAEVLVEGFAAYGGTITKSLRRMKASPDLMEKADEWRPDAGSMLLEWLDEKTLSGTYEMKIQGEDPAFSIEKVSNGHTDFIIAKKVLSNMKEYLDSGRTVEGLMYLKQLHI